MKQKYNSYLINGVDLTIYSNSLHFLVLAISSNYLGNTFGCQLQKILNESLLSQQIMIFITIYFGLDFSGDSNLNPINSLTTALYIHIFYLIFTHIDYRLTAISFGLLTAIYYINKSIKYYYDPKKPDKTKKLINIKKNMLIALFSIVIIGFIIQFNTRYNEYSLLSNTKENFLSWFFIDNKNCEGLSME